MVVLMVSGLAGSVALFVTDGLPGGPATLSLVAVQKSGEGASISFSLIPPLLAGASLAPGVSGPQAASAHTSGTPRSRGVLSV